MNLFDKGVTGVTVMMWTGTAFLSYSGGVLKCNKFYEDFFGYHSISDKLCKQCIVCSGVKCKVVA